VFFGVHDRCETRPRALVSNRYIISNQTPQICRCHKHIKSKLKRK